MKIEILGTGCPTCLALGEAVKEVALEKGVECEVEKVTDLDKITAYGVMMTPAIVVDGDVKVSGKFPTKEEIESMICAV